MAQGLGGDLRRHLSAAARKTLVDEELELEDILAAVTPQAQVPRPAATTYHLFDVEHSSPRRLRHFVTLECTFRLSDETHRGALHIVGEMSSF